MRPAPLIRRLIWLYFFLWVFEGALRFWVLPGLSNPLLIVRDPVVIAIYMIALSAGLMPMNGFATGCFVLSIAAFAFAVVIGHGNVVVALYGVRAAFLHLPLIFVIQRLWRQEDMDALGKVLLWMAVPMAFLAVYQFSSPAESWINQGGMRAHYSTVRPAGTFSFVSGMVAFASLVTAFLANSFTSQRQFGVVRSTAAAGAALAMVAVSNSRTMTFSVGIIFVMMIGLILFRGTRAVSVLMLLGVVGLATSTLSSTEFFDEGTASLKRRFVEASGGKGVLDGAVDRVFGDFATGIAVTEVAEWFGHGVGYGTNAGAQMLTGQRVFLSGETEWTRVVLELGPVLGWIFLIMRMAVAGLMLKAGFKAMRQDNLLPMLLFGAGAMPVVMGQWGIPTNQGFATLIAGFCLAGARLNGGQRKQRSTVVVEPTDAGLTLLGPPFEPALSVTGAGVGLSPSAIQAKEG